MRNNFCGYLRGIVLTSYGYAEKSMTVKNLLRNFRRRFFIVDLLLFIRVLSPLPPSRRGGLVRGNLKFWLKSSNLSASLLEGGGPRSSGRRAFTPVLIYSRSIHNPHRRSGTLNSSSYSSTTQQYLLSWSFYRWSRTPQRMCCLLRLPL